MSHYMFPKIPVVALVALLVLKHKGMDPKSTGAGHRLYLYKYFVPFLFILFMLVGRTNLDCDLLEEFLTKVGGGRRFSGQNQGGKENAFSCCVLAGMRSMEQRRVRTPRRASYNLGTL